MPDIGHFCVKKKKPRRGLGFVTAVLKRVRRSCRKNSIERSAVAGAVDFAFSVMRPPTARQVTLASLVYEHVLSGLV
jgi:hypothetical protein